MLDPWRRWTPAFRQEVWDSRVQTTHALARAVAEHAAPGPHRAFVSVSGVGYYAPSDAVATEATPGGTHDELARLCTAWEAAAAPAVEASVRTAVVRLGVVLGRHGGALQQAYWPFYLGLGGRLGSGTQPFPWIHLSDAVRVY